MRSLVLSFALLSTLAGSAQASTYNIRSAIKKGSVAESQKGRGVTVRAFRGTQVYKQVTPERTYLGAMKEVASTPSSMPGRVLFRLSAGTYRHLPSGLEFHVRGR